MTDILKSLSIKFYDEFISTIFKQIFIENEKSINFYKNLENKELNNRYIVELPLFTMSGGEAINLYSDEKKPTKDLDLKLIVAGKYSMSDSFYENSNITSDFKIKYIFENSPICSTDVWKQYINQKKENLVNDNYKNIFNYLGGFKSEVYKNTLESRKSFFFNLLKYFKNVCINNEMKFLYTMNFIPINNSKIYDIKNIEKFFNDILTIDKKSYIDDGEYVIIPLYIMIPRIQMGWRNERIGHFPYFVDFGRDVNNVPNKNIIFNKNNIDQFLSFFIDIETQIQLFLNLSDNDEITIFDMYHKLLTLIRRKRALSSMVNTKINIKINKNTSDFLIEISDEGFIDVWTDFSAQYTETSGKKIYDYKLETGDVPCILEHIDFDTKRYFIKIPTINWLIRDQVRMLLHGLRKETIYSQDWTEDTVVKFTEQDIDPLKYSDKILGMISGYYKVIDGIENDIKDGKSKQYYNMFENCRQDFDYIGCGPDAFISELFKSTYNKKYWDERIMKNIL